MKALTILQPWATLVIIGAKGHETRSWPCPPSLVGELLAVHAGKSFPDAAVGLTYHTPFNEVLRTHSGCDRPSQLPLGAVLGLVRVVECRQTGNWCGRTLSPRERAFGDFTQGRWAWKVEVVERFAEPIPARGAQGLWEWSDPR